MDKEIKNLLSELGQDIKELKAGQELVRKEANEKFQKLGNEVREIKDMVNILVDFERSTTLAHEKIDSKLKSIDNGIKILAQEDFRLKTDILDVKEDLKVIKGGKH